MKPIARTQLTEKKIKAFYASNKAYEIQDAKCPDLWLRINPDDTKNYFVKAVIQQRSKRKKIGSIQLYKVSQARIKAQELVQRWYKEAEQALIVSSALFADYVQHNFYHGGYQNYKPSTQITIMNALVQELTPYFGRYPMHLINHQMIFNWFEECSVRTPGRANRLLDVLSSVFKQAVIERQCLTNPCEGIQRNPTQSMNRFLSQPELKQLAKVLDKESKRSHHHKQHTDIVKLLLYTGCRLSEILHLTQDKVKAQELHLEDSKTGARVIPLSKAAQNILKPYRKLKRKILFPDKKNITQFRDDFSTFWKRIRKQAGIADVRLHDLRHTFASYAVMQGCPLVMVSKMLGHKRYRSTLRYTHVSDPMVIEQAEKVGQMLYETVNKSDYDKQLEILRVEMDMSI
tara:strand:+ start:1699 stop:2904 length:1206 start_codon:yes stop_codon:yes gene_type:complete